MSQTLDSKTFISQAVKILTEIDSLNEQLKSIKEEGKEADLDVPTLIAVAKAITNNKVDNLKEKSEAILDTIEEFRS